MATNWSQSLSRLYNDDPFIKLKNTQSTLPYSYLTNFNYQSGCNESMLPKTSECKPFHIGANTIDADSSLRWKPTHLGSVEYGRVNTELVNRSAYKAGGEGRFDSASVDVETRLLAPESQHSRERTISEKSYIPLRFDIQNCKLAAENYLRGGVQTRCASVNLN